MDCPLGGHPFGPSLGLNPLFANYLDTGSDFQYIPDYEYPQYPPRPSVSSGPPYQGSSSLISSRRRLPPSSLSASDEPPVTRRPYTGYLLPTAPWESLVQRNEPAVIRATKTSLPPGSDVFHHLEAYLGPFKHPHNYLLRPPFLQINRVSLAAFEDFLATHDEASILKHTKLEYIASARRIIACAPPKPYHDCSPPFLLRVLESLQHGSVDTLSRQDTLQVLEISWRARDGSYLVPDAAVAVLDPESEAAPRLWPTIVMEVANNQSYESAVAKVKRWFSASEGMVEVVLLLASAEKEPLVNPACFIEVFRSRAAAAGPDGDGNDDGDTAAVGSESCTRVGSTDNSASTHAPRRPTHPLRDTLHIYQDGPRHVVIPAPSPNPGTQHISLRYSDFFGSENVPADRDPAEEVKLPLEPLREELGIQLRVAQLQVGSIKRKGRVEQIAGEEKRARRG